MNWHDISPATLTALIVSVSFAAGLNVYATVFALGVMARLHWVGLPPGLGSLADPWMIALSGLLFAVEFFADKIPGFDLLWNALHTFVRVPVAALLAFAASAQLSPEMHLLVTGLGALVALIAHSSKTALRVAVTPSPEPVSNIALSSTEDVAAIGLSWVALHHPLLAGISVGCVCVAGVGLIWASVRALRAAWGRVRDRVGGVGRELRLRS